MHKITKDGYEITKVKGKYHLKPCGFNQVTVIINEAWGVDLFLLRHKNYDNRASKFSRES